MTTQDIVISIVISVLAIGGGLYLGMYLILWVLYPWALIFHIFTMGMFPPPEPPSFNLFKKSKKK